MKKQNVLIISYSYPPSNEPAAQRPFVLAKYLDKSKYTVSVITCSNPDTPLGIDPNFNNIIKGIQLIKIKSSLGNTSKIRDLTVSNTSNQITIKIKTKLIQFLSSLIFPDKAIFWYFNVIRFLKKNHQIANDTNVLFTTSPLITNHLIGLWIKKKKQKTTWIADFRDFHFVGNWDKKVGLLKILHKKLENKVMIRANTIIFTSNSMKEIYAKHYNRAINQKFKIVYNGFDTQDFENINFKKVVNKKLTIFYAGTFYKGIRSPFHLMQLLDASFRDGFLSKDEVHIKIAGNFDSVLIEQLKNYKSFECIEFLGRIPRTQVLKEMATSDFLWLIVGNLITHYAAVPIKFYEYLAARRPILNFAPKLSESTLLMKKLDVGLNISTDPFHIEEALADFKETILLYKEDKKMLDPIPKNRANLFSRKIQAKEIQDYFDMEIG